MSADLRVLLVDDDEDYFIVTRDLLEEAGGGFALDWTPEYEAGLQAMTGNGHDVCVVDYRLGPRNGIELLAAARGGGCTMPVVLFTGTGDHDVDVQAMKAGAVDYLDKGGITAPVLERTLRYAVERSRKDAELRKSHQDLLAILNQLRIGVAVVEADGRLAFLSQRGREMLDRLEEEAVGLHWERLPFAAEDRARLSGLMQSPADQREKLSVHVETESQTHVWLEVEVNDDPRDPARKMLLLYDVTELHDLRQELDKKAQFHDLVGKCEPMQTVYQAITDLSGVDATVLVEGETGTGKELVARAIHYASHRKDKPFVAVNCAGLTESLLGSQLFGHKRGAFTGAVEDQAGVFETAVGGTIFLDEIGDITAGVQSSLLRVLQEKEITRLGETTPRKIDVRIVAATHRDLPQMVEAGDFRMDLLYRIRVARIVLPPLRDRRADIPLLVETFLRRFRATSNKDVQRVGEAALGLLLNHAWPGNVRELQSAIEFAVIRCKGSVIEVADLPPELQQAAEPTPVLAAPEMGERDRVLEALRLAAGNRVAAAKILGVSRSTLYRRLAELGIETG